MILLDYRKGVNMMDFIKKNKKLLIVIGIVLVLLIGVLVYYLNKDTLDEKNDLSIRYVNGDEISFKDLSNNKTYEKKIVVKNDTNELKTYSLSWLNISNNYKEQNKLTYEIKGEGNRAASLDKSQVPVVGSNVFNSVAILGNTEHTYTIKFSYSGSSDKSNSFKGVLRINSEKIVNKDNNVLDKVKDRKSLKKEA